MMAHKRIGFVGRREHGGRRGFLPVHLTSLDLQVDLDVGLHFGILGQQRLQSLGHWTRQGSHAQLDFLAAIGRRGGACRWGGDTSREQKQAE